MNFFFIPSSIIRITFAYNWNKPKMIKQNLKQNREKNVFREHNLIKWEFYGKSLRAIGYVYIRFIRALHCFPVQLSSLRFKVDFNVLFFVSFVHYLFFILCLTFFARIFDWLKPMNQLTQYKKKTSEWSGDAFNNDLYRNFNRGRALYIFCCLLPWDIITHIATYKITE